jgi:predicted  nucleic acid-binding Zn-ribbon protein
LEDDKKSQRKAVVDYNVLLKEISFVRVNTKKTLNKEKKEIISIKSRLRGEEKRRSDANSVLKSSNAGKSAKSADCQRKRTNWVSESKHRAYEISIVSKLQKFLATRYETMKGYLSKRKSSK